MRFALLLCMTLPAFTLLLLWPLLLLLRPLRLLLRPLGLLLLLPSVLCLVVKRQAGIRHAHRHAALGAHARLRLAPLEGAGIQGAAAKQLLLQRQQLPQEAWVGGGLRAHRPARGTRWQQLGEVVVMTAPAEGWWRPLPAATCWTITAHAFHHAQQP